MSNSRISENPDNFAAVFNAAMDTARGVREGRLEVAEATSISRSHANANKALDGDLKARLVDHRLRMKTIDHRGSPPSEALPKD